MAEDTGTRKIKQDDLLPSRREANQETFSQEDIDQLAGFLSDDEDDTGPVEPVQEDDTGSFKPIKE